MRRAALQVFRSARRPLTRRILRNRVALTNPFNHALGLRSLSSRRNRYISPTLTSSMHIGRLSVAFISTLVAGGAFYAYRGTQNSEGGHDAAGVRWFSQLLGQVNRNTASAFTSATASLVDEATASARRTVVLDGGQVYTGMIGSDEPLSKETDDYGRKVLGMMTPEQATQKLRKNEESWLVSRGPGVVRYDVVQLPSNDPIEDDHAERIIEVPPSVTSPTEGSANTDWMFWGVFDGHSGWTTSARLRQALIAFVARELNTTYKAALTNSSLKIPTPESIDSAIKQGFLRLDHEIVEESVNKVTKAQSKRLAAELLAPALSGSCALLSFYDSRSQLLRVACTGDSRAVLGRRGASGKWTATPLSVDQTGGNEEEAARLRKEHPGEEYVTMNGRILGGLEPSRAFGDAVYKWSLATQERIKNHYFGRNPSKLLRTPPYVTAEPVVTTTKVEPQKGDFVVMATDGLWEMLTNEEVVGLVGQWLEDQAASKRNQPGSDSGSSWLSSWFRSQKNLPIEKVQGGKADAENGQRIPIRQQQWGMTGDLNERFVVEDKNAATHLVRNALGGKDRDQVCALLTLPSPYSRRYRDDLTVEVIFFGETESSGSVSLNKEASAMPADGKAKL